MPSSTTRVASAALLGNEKAVEVVLDIAKRRVSTAQQVASSTGIPHSLIGPVLRRLEAAGVVVALPRVNKRSAQFYEPIGDDPVWTSLLGLCRTISTSRIGDPERESAPRGQ